MIEVKVAELEIEAVPEPVVEETIQVSIQEAVITSVKIESKDSSAPPPSDSYQLEETPAVAEVVVTEKIAEEEIVVEKVQLEKEIGRAHV